MPPAAAVRVRSKFAGKRKAAGDGDDPKELPQPRKQQVRQDAMRALKDERWLYKALKALGWQQVPFEELEAAGDCWAIACLAHTLEKKHIRELPKRLRTELVAPIRVAITEAVKPLDAEEESLIPEDALRILLRVTRKQRPGFISELAKWHPSQGRYYKGIGGPTVALLMAARAVSRNVLLVNAANDGPYRQRAHGDAPRPPPPPHHPPAPRSPSRLWFNSRRERRARSGYVRSPR